MQPGILREQMTAGRALMYRGQWIADYPDAETFLIVFNGDMPAPPNYTRFRDPGFDELYRRSLLADEPTRKMLYREMDSIAIRSAPLIPLYYDQRLHFLQREVVGFRSNPMNIIDLKRVRKD
jgi:peptide/nickel transport system substrate-binding protein